MSHSGGKILNQFGDYKVKLECVTLDLKSYGNRVTAAAVISRLRISNNGELKEI